MWDTSWLGASLALFLAACSGPEPAATSPVLGLGSSEEAVTIRADGELFARLEVPLGRPVALTHLRSPSGTELLRGYPLAPRPGESVDHPEHTGGWIAHASVNGHDVWNGPGFVRAGEHLVHLDGSDAAVVDVDLEWLSEEAEVLFTEERRYSFSARTGVRIVDVDQSIATTSVGLALGDEKDGYFALRMADTFRWGEGTTAGAIASTGARDDDVWGERARWVARHAPIGGAGEVMVILLDHPSNPLHPATCNVRRYGLFAMNPFGRAAYSGDERERTDQLYDAYREVTFQYRIVVAEERLAYEEIDELWREFAERTSPFSDV
ncbi:MAG: DUF6807 family protein [Planctomycetota bacterium]